MLFSVYILSCLDVINTSFFIACLDVKVFVCNLMNMALNTILFWLVWVLMGLCYNLMAVASKSNLFFLACLGVNDFVCNLMDVASSTFFFFFSLFGG